MGKFPGNRFILFAMKQMVRKYIHKRVQAPMDFPGSNNMKQKRKDIKKNLFILWTKTIHITTAKAKGPFYDC